MKVSGRYIFYPNTLFAYNISCIFIRERTMDLPTEVCVPTVRQVSLKLDFRLTWTTWWLLTSRNSLIRGHVACV